MHLRQAIAIAVWGAILAGGLSASALPCLAGPLSYFVDWKATRATPPAPREETTGEYTCTITRTAHDSTESRLLAIAECVYPPRALLNRIAENNGFEVGRDTARVPLWWCKGTSERRIPYAATRAALEYYLKLTQKYRDHEYREPGTERIFTSALVYHASIGLEDDFAVEEKRFRNVYVAHISMSWTYDDGVFLPFVAARRTVVLSRGGEILAVDGDGQAIEDVSISANRTVGRVRQLEH